MLDDIIQKLGATGFGALSPELTISEVELKLGISLPKSLTAILRHFSRSVIFNNGAKFRPSEKTPVDDSEGFQNIDILYGPIEDQNGILKKNAMYLDQLPNGLIAIGETTEGNQICLNSKRNIVFWHHEALQDSQSTYLISSDFETFLSSLEPDSVSSNSYKIDGANSFLDF